MTQKLFDENAYQAEFEATVVSQTQTELGWEVVLDKTCFFPEGGGQDSDAGTLNGQKVKKLVKTDDGDIIHVMQEKIEQSTIIGQIDWKKRFRNMQQHSGQHILSGVLLNTYKLQTESASFTEKEGHITLEWSIPDNDLEKALIAANEIIFANKPIITKFISLDEIEKYNLAKLPKDKFTKTGKIRIWQIEGFYTIPCGGTHCKSTGEIGNIFVKSNKIHGNRTDLNFTTGFVTLDYLTATKKITSELAKMLEVGTDGLVDATKKVMDDRHALNLALRENQEQVAAQKAVQILQTATKGKVTFTAFVYSEADKGTVKTTLYQLAETPNSVHIAHGANVPLTVVSSKDVSLDTLSILTELKTKFNGKGGGSKTYWQAMITDHEQFVKELMEKLS
ncbi:MAG: alanyl-tRNA editing protein [Patescibacteria group bacterium]|jgi:alanyl-tRNA synthetase